MTVYLVSITFRDGYLYCKYQGDLNTHEKTKDNIDSIFQHCRKHACLKILLDCLDVDYSRLSITDEHTLAVFLSSLYSNHFKIAILTRDVPGRPNKHLENVCTNRGINLKVFFEHESEEAVLWLKNVF
jgi:hypothetical protein